MSSAIPLHPLPCEVCQISHLWHLSWQTQLLSFQNFRYVKVEEVAVKDRLNHACDDGDHVKEALKVEAPDPVDEVEGAVKPQEEQVVSSDGFRLARLTDHEELW